MNYKKRNFSVIELISACAVIVILMTISLGVYRLVITKINETKTKSLIKKLEMAMRSYKNDTGYYFQTTSYVPLHISDTDTDFTQLIDYSGMRGKNEIDVNGYVIDAWGNRVYYNNGDDKKNTTLFDLGSPGKSATWGLDENVEGYHLYDIESNDDYKAKFGTGDDITNTNM